MKSKLKRIIGIGSLLAASCVITLSAANLTAQSVPHYTVIVDGKQQTFTDNAGKAVSPIVIDGVTYLPLKPLANAFGKEVNWDGATSTINVGNPTKGYNLIEVDAQFDGSGFGTKVKGADSLTFANIGSFQNAVKLSSINSASKAALFTLAGNYTKLDCKVLYVPDKALGDNEKITFTISDKTSKINVIEKTITSELLTLKDVDINGIKNLQFSGKSSAAGNPGTLYFLDVVVR